MIWYNGNIKYEQELSFKMEASILFGLLKYKYVYDSDDLSGLYLFGKRIKSHKSFNKSVKNDKENQDSDDQKSDNRFENIKNKLNNIVDFISDEDNITRIKNVKKIIIKLIKHVFPKELEGELHYGLDDPFLTGKVLEIFALLYALNGDKFKVYPYWDEIKFECNISFKGRIVIIYSLFILCKLLLNKDFIYLWRKFNGK